MAVTDLLWLGLLILWQKLVGKGALESAAQTENAVIRLLWWETLDGGEDDFGLLWDQVIASGCVLVYALPIPLLFLCAQVWCKSSGRNG